MYEVRLDSQMYGAQVFGPFATREEAEAESERYKASGGYSFNAVSEVQPADVVVDALDDVTPITTKRTKRTKK
jgi:hypothetical protein